MGPSEDKDKPNPESTKMVESNAQPDLHIGEKHATMSKSVSFTDAQQVDELGEASNGAAAGTATADGTSTDADDQLDDSGDEARGLEALGAAIRNQDDLERNINRQADELLVERANDRDRKRLERAEREKSQLELQVRRLHERLENEPNVGPATSRRIAAELSTNEGKIKTLKDDIADIASRIEERESSLQKGDSQKGAGERLASESQREFLIRTGKITPFSKPASGRSKWNDDDNLEDALLEAEQETPEEDRAEGEAASDDFRSHRDLLKPGFTDSSTEVDTDTPAAEDGPRKRRRLVRGKRPQKDRLPDVAEKTVEHEDEPAAHSEGSYVRAGSEEYVSMGTTETEEGEEYDSDSTGSKRKRSKISIKEKKQDVHVVDDGNESLYQKRLQEWIRKRSGARQRAQGSTVPEGYEESTPEWHLPHPTIADKDMGGDFRIPGDVYPALFDYQKTGVQWLWELYSQRVGGIVGDEMGLGKTIQLIAFLSGLHYSKKLTQPVIVVAPATLLKQWVGEFHRWWPALRVSILHSSGSGMINVGRESQHEADLQRGKSTGRSAPTKQARAAKKIVDRVVSEGHVLITTYSGLQMHANLLIPVKWGYAVLDEGHTIRNPNTSLTLHCKELATPHRVILSGTPIQNNLIELWSLFDFVFPMRLGNLVDFKHTFEIPIRLGGYANASNLQVQTANRCAQALKDAISPYLLQRNKVDVAADLPKKIERVLFCQLTRPQREAYEAYLNSSDMDSIMTGNRQVLSGVDLLRKICNHPDLQDHRGLSVKEGYKYGSPNKSGKMIIVRELLNVWKKAGHKTLLFSQHKIMLDILEEFIRKLDGVNYRRMDGSTPINSRQGIIDEFNKNPDIHVFLLTTKVGGLGTNLTGANRVIIFDPDWNPSTDMQARERAWRLGQKREVEIYRLMMTGTIEEKIFHRQIFKQFLSNKILKDPKQRQTFQMQDLHDLFSLGESGEIESETGRLFKGTETRFEKEERYAMEAASSSKTPADDKGKGKAKETAEEAEIRNITGVTSMAAYEVEEEEEASTNGEEGGGLNSSSRIMSALFARSGVTSAFEHDHIINGSGKRVPAADARMVEREAAKVAREAAEALRKHEIAARNVEIGTVTWTGEHGSAGRPGESSKRSGPGSSQLLSNLQRRREENTKRAAIAAASTQQNDHGSSREGTPSAKEQRDISNTSAGRFAKDIRSFLIRQGGQAPTRMVIDAFSYRCRSARRNQEFQAVLKEMATIERGTGGRGSWVLKEQFH